MSFQTIYEENGKISDYIVESPGGAIAEPPVAWRQKAMTYAFFSKLLTFALLHILAHVDPQWVFWICDCGTGAPHGALKFATYSSLKIRNIITLYFSKTLFILVDCF